MVMVMIVNERFFFFSLCKWYEAFHPIVHEDPTQCVRQKLDMVINKIH